jgi:hypothetical protein
MVELVTAQLADLVSARLSKKRPPDGVPQVGEKTRQLPLRQRTGFFRNDDQQKSGCIRDSKAARCWLGGFALSPIRAVFLDGSRLGVEPAVKGSNPHLVPCLPFRERGTPSPTNKD